MEIYIAIIVTLHAVIAFITRIIDMKLNRGTIYKIKEENKKLKNEVRSLIRSIKD